jgi:hypothetical protein
VVVVVAAGCGRIRFAELDAASGDGRTADSRADTSGDAAPPGTCPAFAMFCDDFETGDISKWTMPYMTPGATLVVDGVQVHSGTHALHGIVPPGSPGDAAAAVYNLPSARTTGVLAVRAWIYPPVPLTRFDGVLIYENNVGVNPSLLVGGDNTPDWVASEGLSGGSTVDHSSTVLTTLAMWTCVEVDYTFGSPSNIEVFVGDVSVLSVSANETTPRFDQLFAGVARAQVNGDEMIVDDVVLASQHIGCQ